MGKAYLAKIGKEALCYTETPVCATKSQRCLNQDCIVVRPGEHGQMTGVAKVADRQDMYIYIYMCADIDIV